MAVAFRAIATNNPSGAAVNTNISKPTGTVDNDIMLACVYVETDVAVTAPAGWTLICDLDHTVANFDMWVYWKRASSEGTTYSFTHASAFEEGSIASYSGCTTAGDPQDATASQNQNTGTVETATGVTTASDGAAVVGIFACSEGVTGQSGPPTGMSERFGVDGENLYWADVIQTSAGASGDKTLATALLAGSRWGAVLVALKPPATPAGGLGYYRSPNRSG